MWAEGGGIIEQEREKATLHFVWVFEPAQDLQLVVHLLLLFVFICPLQQVV